KNKRSIIPFDRLNRLRAEWLKVFPQTGQSEIASELTSLVGADWIVQGEYRLTDETLLSIHLELFDVLTGSILWNLEMTTAMVFKIPEATARVEQPVKQDTPLVTVPTPALAEIVPVIPEPETAVVPMVLIPAGNYSIGSNSNYPEEQPVHEVFLDDFMIDIHEVTNDAFSRCKTCQKGTGIFDTTNPLQPVVYVDWENANNYCEFVGKRLPTEAEWEVAARSGSPGKYAWGDDVTQMRDYAWFAGNMDEKPGAHDVSILKPNSLGIYDMQGNVMEWVMDWFDPAYYPVSDPMNPKGPMQAVSEEYPLKGVRGGAWGGEFGTGSAENMRVAHRMGLAPWTRAFHLGFRCVSTGTTVE
ncbi:MAG: SUMF1/EgtB/PvdO family nonheme iron enzyme, partial [SAR324 cluster bacterium]|nr:SUMF1/EgtB/PvdO family nonheme iron enzyme [SAR324 cluster bacterium]